MSVLEEARTMLYVTNQTMITMAMSICKTWKDPRWRPNAGEYQGKSIRFNLAVISTFCQNIERKMHLVFKTLASFSKSPYSFAIMFLRFWRNNRIVTSALLPTLAYYRTVKTWTAALKTTPLKNYAQTVPKKAHNERAPLSWGNAAPMHTYILFASTVTFCGIDRSCLAWHKTFTKSLYGNKLLQSHLSGHAV